MGVRLENTDWYPVYEDRKDICGNKGVDKSTRLKPHIKTKPATKHE